MDKKTLAKVLEAIEFDKDLYDVYTHDELLEFASDFIETYWIELATDCDYWNDENDDWNYYCDMSSERADSQVDIYHNDLREKARDFKYFIEEARDEFWPSDDWLERDFMMWQYLYYSRLANDVLNTLATLSSEIE